MVLLMIGCTPVVVFNDMVFLPYTCYPIYPADVPIGGIGWQQPPESFDSVIEDIKFAANEAGIKVDTCDKGFRLVFKNA